MKKKNVILLNFFDQVYHPPPLSPLHSCSFENLMFWLSWGKKCDNKTQENMILKSCQMLLGGGGEEGSKGSTITDP